MPGVTFDAVLFDRKFTGHFWRQCDEPFIFRSVYLIELINLPAVSGLFQLDRSAFPEGFPLDEGVLVRLKFIVELEFYNE